jgi:hypothetical protein
MWAALWNIGFGLDAIIFCARAEILLPQSRGHSRMDSILAQVLRNDYSIRVPLPISPFATFKYCAKLFP